MGKFCILLIVAGGLSAFIGLESGSQNAVFVGVLALLAGGAGVDRMMRPF